MIYTKGFLQGGVTHIGLFVIIQ